MYVTCVIQLPGYATSSVKFGLCLAYTEPFPPRYLRSSLEDYRKCLAGHTMHVRHPVRSHLGMLYSVNGCHHGSWANDRVYSSQQTQGCHSAPSRIPILSSQEENRKANQTSNPDSLFLEGEFPLHYPACKWGNYQLPTFLLCGYCVR